MSDGTRDARHAAWNFTYTAPRSDTALIAKLREFIQRKDREQHATAGAGSLHWRRGVIDTINALSSLLDEHEKETEG